MSASMNVVGAYVPSLVLKGFAEGPIELVERGIERQGAAVLFADISGFTILAERLANRGASGSEELSNALNAYFDRLIELIAAHGGDVVKMAGDALIALWPATGGESLASMTMRAARCGLVVQETLRDYEVGDGTRLTSKVGIGAGEVASMFVGGEKDRWEWLLAGDPVVQMGLAEHLARPGQVVLSRQAWELIRDDSIGVPLEDGLVLVSQVRAEPPRASESPRPGPGAAELSRLFIPAAIRARLDAGQTAWLAELRRLTVLFINLPSTDCDLPDALTRARQIFRTVQAELYRHEGSLNKLSVDEKGTTVVAAMGLPPLAHRDDARRAIRAARAIRVSLERLGVACSIGIASGRVYCGEVGNARRREYTIVGRVVNLAARLMQAAKEHREILCDEETSRATRGCFHFEALSPRRLKNIEGFIGLYRPLEEVADGCQEERPTVGRKAEREMLRAGLEALREGRNGLIFIEGEAGIGKSQLVADLVRQAKVLGGVTVLVGGGDSIERSTPYHAWRTSFEQLAGKVDGLEIEARFARVSDWLGDDPDLLGFAPLLNAVLPLDLPENEVTTPMVGQARLDNTNDLLHELLWMASERAPLILVLEDAHWMDSASWALTLMVARKLGNTLLVVTSRPRASAFPEQYEDLAQLATEIVRLGNLPTEEVRELACRSLGVDSLPEAAEALIVQRAQGNPFYCEELSHALLDAGLLTREGGHCRVASGIDLAKVGIPDSVEGLINDRVDRLSPSQQLALKVASVIGRLFSLRLLQDIYPIEPDRVELPEYLDSLSRLELILRDEPEPELAYLFRHIITRDVVYDLLPFAQRRRLHHAIAEWYERASAGDLSPNCPVLAHHWSLAGEDDRAIDALEVAGEQALKGGAYREAVDFLDRAVALQDRKPPGNDPERLARWEYQLGEAHLSLGHLVRSREHAARALNLLGRPIPSLIRLPMAYLGQIALQVVRRIRHSTRPRRESEASGARRLASAAYGLVGQLCYFDQDRAIGVYSALRSLNLAEAEPPSTELARGLVVMCIACGLVPAHRLAEIYRTLTFAVASEITDTATRIWVLQLTGMYDLGIGRWDEARGNLERAVGLSRRLGDWRRWEESSGELARVDYYLGNYEASAARFGEFGEMARRRGHDQAYAWSLHGLTKNLYRLGRFDEALARIDESLALPGEALGGGDSILRGGLLALVRARLGQWSEARRAADETSRLIRLSPPMVAYSLEGYAGVAEAYLALWEAGQGPRIERAAWWGIVRLKRIARVYPVGLPRAWLLGGMADRLAGRPDRALKAWYRSLRASEAMSMPFEQALARLEIGRLLEKSDPAGREHLIEASRIFARLGSGYFRDQVEEIARP